MVILLSFNPGRTMLGVLDARSMINKGSFLANSVTSDDFDFFCLAETHVRSSDTNSFLQSITPDFVLLQRPRISGIGGGVCVFIRCSYTPQKIEAPVYSSFEKIVVAIVLPRCTLLFACVYHPPGSCTCNFVEELISFVGFLSSINCVYYICGDFNIHVDVPVGDGDKFYTFLISCDLKQSASQPTHLHSHILILIIPQ